MFWGICLKGLSQNVMRFWASLGRATLFYLFIYLLLLLIIIIKTENQETLKCEKFQETNNHTFHNINYGTNEYLSMNLRFLN